MLRHLHFVTSAPLLAGPFVSLMPKRYDVHHSRSGPSDHALQHLAGPDQRVPALAARPDALRGRPFIRFVRNDQHDVLFRWLTLPERVQPRRGRGSLCWADTRGG
jgi:hypothetical protein